MSETPKPAAPSPSTPAPRRAPPSTAARLAIQLGAIAVLFLLLELVVRVLGAGDPMAFGGSKLQYQQIYPPLFEAAGKPGRMHPRDPRLVDRSFSVSAPPQRIFVYGESAVRGLGMSENTSFARALERQLRSAGSDAQVVNVGVVALDSRQIIACVKDTASLKPDWVVLHVGNNEFLETHAWRFLKATKKLPTRAAIDDVLQASRLYLAIKQAGIRGKTKTLSPALFSIESLRGSGGGGGAGAVEDPGSERELVKAIESAGLGVTEGEIAEAARTHKARMREAIELAKAEGAKVILMTVATNLEWEGVRDPEGGWLAKAAGGEVPKDEPSRTAKLQAALAAHDKQVADKLPSLEHWRALYERAWLKRALGDARGAHDDFQAANDQDPHLRRCLAVMNENMRALAQETGALLVDGERTLAAASKDGITGFDMLYDYVHFTPEGNERIGAELAKAILGSGAKPDAIDALVAARRAKLAAQTQDFLEVGEYVGFHGDRAMLSDRDLWKYEKAHDALDHVPDPRKADDKPGKVQAGTATPEELVWAGDYAALQVGGEPRAKELWEKARAAKPELAAVVDANLKWLESR